MAESKKAAEAVKGSAEWYQEKVPVKLFRDSGKYKDDVYVGVNGKGYLIKRGEEVMVPRFVAEVLAQGMDQDAATAELMERESAQYETETQRLGLN